MRWLDRALARVGLARVSRRAYYAGAQMSRLVADWAFAPLVSARKEFQADGPTLRARAREMVRDDPTFSRYVTLLADNVVGPEGIRGEPRIYRRDGTLDEEASREIGYELATWYGKDSCTIDGRLSWAALLHQVVQLVAMDGEVFVQMIPTASNRWGLALRVLDPDLVDHGFTRARTRRENEVVNGIELDADGRAVAYHVWPDYEHRGERQRIAAEWIVHLFWARRPFAVRGVTHFAPVMMLARMLSGYREAEVVAARTAAAKMGFIVQKGDLGPLPTLNEPVNRQQQLSAAPGVIEELAPGQEFQGWSPEHPTTAFDSFVRSVKGDIAAGLNHSYVTLFGDWSQTNYSSGRMPVYQERDHYRTWQRWLIEGLCRPVYAKWLQLAALRGVIELPTPDYRNHLEVLWIPRSWPLFDPQTDIDTMRALLDLKLTSHTRLSAEMGHSWEDTLEQRRADRALATQYGETTEEASNAQGNGQGAVAGGDDRAPRVRVA
jgi:lambda family phage portal protein